MRTLVMKFGGASIATPEHFSRIADIVAQRKQQYGRVAIVVSAMGDTTDQLISLAKKIHPNPPQREYDMLVSAGERISIALLAMALAANDHAAVSFTGSQSGIITCGNHTEARIIEVRPHRLLPPLDQGKIVIVAGFQGVSKNGEITTLGRGGSDTTAVALAVAIGAEKAEFFKPVPGIFEEDPKKNPEAKMHSRLNYDEALSIAYSGAKILHPRCIELASKNCLPLHVRSYLHEFDDHGQTDQTGTWIKNSDQPKNVPPTYETV
jgi:aspartate kinase